MKLRQKKEIIREKHLLEILNIKIIKITNNVTISNYLK